MSTINRNKGLRSILYVYLPLGRNVKIFPVGIACLANYIHTLYPEVKQRILDLSIIEKKNRWHLLRNTLESYGPDLVAFSWRHIRCFGQDYYDQHLRNLMYNAKYNIKDLLPFLVGGIIRWKDYLTSMVDNINYIKGTCIRLSDADVVVGGPGFSVFYKDLLKKMPQRVIGVVGEGEQVLSNLIQGNESNNEQNVSREAHKIYGNGDKNKGNSYLDVKSSIPAIDYTYIRSIFAEYYRYKGETIGTHTNRGCKQRCIYCPDNGRTRNSVAYRDSSEVVQEIRNIKNTFDTNKIWFTDRLIVSNGDTINFGEILEKIISQSIDIQWSGYMRPECFTKKLSELIVHSGLNKFIVPITSGSQKIIDSLKLGISVTGTLRGCRFLKEAGYKGPVDVEFTLGILKESTEDIRSTIEVYDKIKSIFDTQQVNPIFNFCSVLPESELEQKLIDEGYFSENYNRVSLNPWLIRKFAYIHPSLRKIMQDAYSYAYLQKNKNNKYNEEFVVDFLRNKFCKKLF